MANQPRSGAARQQQQSRPQEDRPHGSAGGGGGRRPPPPPKDVESITSAITKAVDECGVDAISKLPAMQQLLKLSQGITALRAAMTDEFVESILMPLRGSPLGFLTDKDSKPEEKDKYPLSVVRECVIDAWLRGFQAVGNEMNIISGKFYGAKAGFERLVLEYPGLTELILEPGVPQPMGESVALVPFIASWKLNGHPMRMDCVKVGTVGEDGKVVGVGPDMRIPVKVNSGMGPDAIIGKAYRKVYFRIWARLKGGTFGLMEGDASETIDTQGEAAPVNERPSTKAGALRGMASAHQAKKASVPPPANDAPAQQVPTDVDPAKVLAELGAADPDWATGDSSLLEAIRGWTPLERLDAFEWASIRNDPTAKEDEIPERPEWTTFERQPGEEG